MLLEDNEDLSLSIEEIMQLERPDFKLTTFANGNDAWNFLKGNKSLFDVIVLDNMVPGMKGLEICNNIQKDNELNKVPVIIQSGKMRLNSEEEAEAAGAYAYKTKPYPSSELIELITKAIS